jgi:hypothetical protein
MTTLEPTGQVIDGRTAPFGPLDRLNVQGLQRPSAPVMGLASGITPSGHTSSANLSGFILNVAPQASAAVTRGLRTS